MMLPLVDINAIARKRVEKILVLEPSSNALRMNCNSKDAKANVTVSHAAGVPVTIQTVEDTGICVTRISRF